MVFERNSMNNEHYKLMFENCVYKNKTKCNNKDIPSSKWGSQGLNGLLSR